MGYQDSHGPLHRDTVDRRRERRAVLQVPIRIQRVGFPYPAESEEAVTLNVSLGGVYFETDHPQAYAPNDVLVASVSIPETLTREFPFTRLAGRSRVVRVDEMPEARAPDATRYRVALEFGENLTVLSAIRS